MLFILVPGSAIMYQIECRKTPPPTPGGAGAHSCSKTGAARRQLFCEYSCCEYSCEGCWFRSHGVLSKASQYFHNVFATPLTNIKQILINM